MDDQDVNPGHSKPEGLAVPTGRVTPPTVAPQYAPSDDTSDAEPEALDLREQKPEN